jgi:hypothetical protein
MDEGAIMQPLTLLLLMSTTQLAARAIVWAEQEKIDHEKMAPKSRR